MRHARTLLRVAIATGLLLAAASPSLAQGALGPPGPPLSNIKEDPSADPRDFQGLWKGAPINAPPFTLLDVPMLPKARLTRNAWAAIQALGRPVASEGTSCRFSSLQSTLFPLFVTAVVQTPDNVFMLFEEPRLVRKIRLNGQHPADLEPGYRGDSIGHWEGNTLVVDTIGFNGVGEIDITGLPTSPKFHMIERITKSADGKALDFEITLEDPEYYSAPFSVRRRWLWSVGDPQVEYDCEDSPRAADIAETVYLNKLYEPVCVRVDGTGDQVSHVICNKPRPGSVVD